MKRTFAILLVALTTCFGLAAQDYRYEIGGGIGMSGYLGDANRSNLWANPGFAAQAQFRYIFNSRWALKGSLGALGISGDTQKQQQQYPLGENYSFKSTVVDAGAQMEFNFLNYGIGSKYLKLKRISPYMVVGLGFSYATGDGDGAFGVNIPMGVGLKYKVKERLNLGAQFTMHKAFTDRLDGLSDLHGISSGFAKNTDWYSMLTISITYEFSKRCRTCHYVD